MNSVPAKALKNIRSNTPTASLPTLDFYEANAAGYSESTRSLDMAIHIRRFRALLEAGARVLDVGCGGGRDLAALRAAGLQPKGLELSPRLAAIAREYSDCEVVVGDMRDPPFADGAFEGIWAAASLLHLERDEIVLALRQLRRITAPGGAFFASMKMGLGAERSADGRLFSYFMPEEWSALLEAAGFADIEIHIEVAKDAAAPTSAWMQSLSRASRP